MLSIITLFDGTKTDKDIERLKNIQDVCYEVCKSHNIDIQIVSIDARSDNKESASKK